MRHHPCSLFTLLFVADIACAADIPASPSSAATQPADLPRGTIGTYAGAPRSADRRVDARRLISELKDLQVNTYSWLIWHEDTDWEDLQWFLPLAREAGIRVWVTLVPPSESPPRTRRYSEPFRLDYHKWAVEIATLSLREPNLIAWSIDDFLHNPDVFSPEKLRPIVSAARAVNPKLAFIPCCYYAQVKRELAKGYDGLFDGVLFPYRNESIQANLKDADQVANEIKDLHALLGANLPIIVDVYATAHSRLGPSTPTYVDQVIRAARASADGVMIYCHQDPKQDAEKYAVIRTQFRQGIPLIPRLDGAPWVVAHDPDLGEFTTPDQQPVDFGIWPAADGTWQLWSCIRRTKCGGTGRLFHRWEGRQLTDADWKPMGIAMQADPKLGETPGGLQAPYVFKLGQEFIMAYGDWVHICFARSQDGKKFERWLLEGSSQAGRFAEGPQDNARDPMILQIGDLWYCYYTAFPDRKGAVFCRTSKDLKTWSEPTRVSYGGQGGTGPTDAECPHVVCRGGYYFLFRTQTYGKNAATHVYRSKDPMQFNLGNDNGYICTLPVAAPEIFQYRGQDYIAYLLPTLKGIQITRLAWEPAAETAPAK